jgi:integrase
MAWIVEKPNGTFLVRWRDEAGRVRSESFPTRELAEERKRGQDGLTRIRKLAGDDGEPTWSQLGDPAWWAEYRKSGRPGPAEDPQFAFATYLRTIIERDRGLRKSTRELYLRNVRNFIDGTTLGETDVREVTPELLSDYWASLDAGNGALRNVHQLLSKALNRAIVAGLIHFNPLKRAPDVKRPPRGRKEEVEPLTWEQVEALADAAKFERDRLEILVMAYGGLRAGEVGGLRRQDIVRRGDRCQLRLRQQVVRVTGEGQYLEELKTKAGKRSVDIPCSLADELDSFIEANPPAPDGRVFHGPNGAMRAHNAILHGVKQAGKRAGLPDTFSHQLRHTAVSLWLEDGASPKDIQRMVGHSDVRETLQTYGHLFDHGGQALADSMERRRQRSRNRSAD